MDSWSRSRPRAERDGPRWSANKAMTKWLPSPRAMAPSMRRRTCTASASEHDAGARWSCSATGNGPRSRRTSASPRGQPPSTTLRGSGCSRMRGGRCGRARFRRRTGPRSVRGAGAASLRQCAAWGSLAFRVGLPPPQSPTASWSRAGSPSGMRESRRRSWCGCATWRRNRALAAPWPQAGQLDSAENRTHFGGQAGGRAGSSAARPSRRAYPKAGHAPPRSLPIQVAAWTQRTAPSTCFQLVLWPCAFRCELRKPAARGQQIDPRLTGGVLRRQRRHVRVARATFGVDDFQVVGRALAVRQHGHVERLVRQARRTPRRLHALVPAPDGFEGGPHFGARLPQQAVELGLRLLVEGAALATQAVPEAAVEERKGEHQLGLPAGLRNRADGRRIGVVERLHDRREERHVIRPRVTREPARRLRALPRHLHVRTVFLRLSQRVVRRRRRGEHELLLDLDGALRRHQHTERFASANQIRLRLGELRLVAGELLPGAY